MKHLFAPLLLCAALTPPAAAQQVDHAALRADALSVLEDQFAAFRDAAQALDRAAQAHCDARTADLDAVKAAFRDAYLAWAPLDSYQIGPVEQLGAALTVNFWPDKKNYVGRGLEALRAVAPGRQRDPAFVAKASAAAQGLPGLERLLYGDGPACPLAVGISGNLAQIGAALYTGWFAPDGWAELMREAGPDNPVYLSDTEVTRALYTAVNFGLQRISDMRLGRPLGDFAHSFPRRAEAWRAGLSAELISAQLDGLARLTDAGFGAAFTPAGREELAQLFAQAQTRLDRIGAPIPEAVQTPQSRVRIETVQTKLVYLREALARIMGAELGIDAGFSAGDGD